MSYPCLPFQVYAVGLAANPGHSPPRVGETNVSTLADEQASASANKEEQITITMIVLIALRLQRRRRDHSH
jgi:hypothetical protein